MSCTEDQGEVVVGRRDSGDKESSGGCGGAEKTVVVVALPLEGREESVYEDDGAAFVGDMYINSPHTEDEPQAPINPRFSTQWDRVNREAYFDEISIGQSVTESIGASMGGKDGFVKVILDNTPSEDVKLKLTVVEDSKAPGYIKNIVRPPWRRSVHNRQYKSCFKYIFSWCLTPQVRNWSPHPTSLHVVEH